MKSISTPFLICAYIAAISCMGAASAENIEPAKIFSAIREHFMLMDSLDVTTKTGTVHGEVAPDPAWTIDTLRAQAVDNEVYGFYDVHYRIKGGLFRNTYNMPLRPNFDYAYDGMRYQGFDLAHRMLLIRSKPDAFGTIARAPQYATPGTLRPYDFIYHMTSEPVSLRPAHETGVPPPPGVNVLSASPVTITSCELEIFVKICSYVCGSLYERKPRIIASELSDMLAKKAGMPLLMMSMYFQPVVSSGLTALCAVDSEPSMYAKVSQPFMNTTTY